MNAEDHEHHFPIVTGYRNGYHYVKSHEPCECGVTWAQHHLDLTSNLGAAYAAWKGKVERKAAGREGWYHW